MRDKLSGVTDHPTPFFVIVQQTVQLVATNGALTFQTIPSHIPQGSTLQMGMGQAEKWATPITGRFPPLLDGHSWRAKNSTALDTP